MDCLQCNTQLPIEKYLLVEDEVAGQAGGGRNQFSVDGSFRAGNMAGRHPDEVVPETDL